MTTARTAMKQDGATHANDHAALPTPTRHENGQEVPQLSAGSTDSHGENPPVSKAFLAGQRPAAADAPGPVMSATADPGATQPQPDETRPTDRRADDAHLTERSGTAPDRKALNEALAAELLAVRDQRLGLPHSGIPRAERLAATARSFRQEEALWARTTAWTPTLLDIGPGPVRTVLITALVAAGGAAADSAEAYERMALKAAERVAQEGGAR